jgi:hypothetical protein
MQYDRDTLLVILTDIFNQVSPCVVYINAAYVINVRNILQTSVFNFFI